MRSRLSMEDTEHIRISGGRSAENARVSDSLRSLWDYRDKLLGVSQLRLSVCR